MCQTVLCTRRRGEGARQVMSVGVVSGVCLGVFDSSMLTTGGMDAVCR